ncbi:hypothetical protein H6504_03620 [Candidatus Woesearchaeota archaeon]|nr:hypothetical protein [Candidatus Woesearchaeota archaeon]
MSKRGEMGISTMLIMIAFIVIAGAIAALMIWSANSLEQEAFKNEQKAEQFVTGSLQLVDIYSMYQEDNTLRNVSMTMKLLVDCEGCGFSDMTISITSDQATASLNYRGQGHTHDHSVDGFYTKGFESYPVPSTVGEDIDGDNVSETISADVNGLVSIDLSNDADIVLGNCSAGTFIDQLSINSYITSVSGTCSGNTVTNVEYEMIQKGGYYVTEYLKQSNPRAVEGKFNKGDIINIMFEMPYNMGEEETATISLIPKSGIAQTMMFTTPQTASIGRASLSHY